MPDFSVVSNEEFKIIERYRKEQQHEEYKYLHLLQKKIMTILMIQQLSVKYIIITIMEHVKKLNLCYWEIVGKILSLIKK